MKESQMSDALRAYAQMALGLGEQTLHRARDAAKGLTTGTAIPPGAPEVAGSVAAVAEDLLSTARANRGLLGDLVRTEVERAVGGLGLVTPKDVQALRSRISRLERDVAVLRAEQDAARADAAPSPVADDVPSPAAGPATKRSAKKPASRATAKKPTAKKPASRATAKTSGSRTAAQRATGTSGSERSPGTAAAPPSVPPTGGGSVEGDDQ